MLLTYKAFLKPWMKKNIAFACFNFRKLNIVLRSSVSTKMVRCFRVTVTLKFSHAHNEREITLKHTPENDIPASVVQLMFVILARFFF